MTETHSIGGSVNNGRTGVAAFPFYKGSVGIRDREGEMEVAFYSQPMRFKLPVSGFVDGQKVTVISVRARDLDPDVPTSTRSTALRAIVATVIPSTEG